MENLTYDNTTNDGDQLALPKWTLMFQMCLEILISIPMFMGNLLVLIAYCKFYVVREENSNVFMFSLGITDITTAVTVPFNTIKKYVAALLGLTAPL